MANENLTNAKKAKNDEFYTQYIDIEKEVSAYLEYDENVFKGKTILLPCDDPEWSNFTKFFAKRFKEYGLKKLISTSYANESKCLDAPYQPTNFEKNNPKYDETKTTKNGKIYTLTHDKTGDGKIDVDDLDWEYLDGDGDFRSDEVKKLRDEVDIIITNPPFSQFRIFLSWIIEANKSFLIIGNINAITYKDVFPLIKDNKVWLGPSITSGDREFEVPEDVVDMEKFTGEIRDGRYYQKVVGVRWFTNLDHGRRHQPLSLMPEKDVIKYSTKKPFEKYDNYDAIEVPYVKFIPNDFDGVMGVPISFLDKYNPEQFEIIGSDYEVKDGKLSQLVNSSWQGKLDRGYINGRRAYGRILIKHKKAKHENNTKN